MFDLQLTKFRLAVLCPAPMDGTSLVRGIGPLAAMAREDRRLELDLCPTGPDGAPEISWDWLVRCDALFLQRPQIPQHVAAAVTARSFGRAVWVDWDDDLTCVPEHNPYRQLYDPAAMRKLIGQLAHLADAITVSTEPLAKRVQGCALFARNASKDMKSGFAGPDRIAVVPNACAWKFSDGPRQPRVVWRGGKSHDADLLEFLPALREVSRLPQFSKWKWCFLGEIGPLVAAKLREAVPEENLESGYADFAHQYISAFGHLGPWVNIVPLQDHAFNRAKSNLAWIEATCAGAMTLAPDWPEWQRPGIVNYENPDRFKAALRGLMELFAKSDPAKGELPERGRVGASRNFIRDHLQLDRVNERRWAILRALAAGGKAESEGKAESRKQKAEMEALK